jgi:trigger factor
MEQEVLRKLVPQALSDALQQESVQPVGEPQVDQITLTKGQPLRFVATTQVIPEFTLTDYRAWPMERRIPRITEAHVDEAMEELRNRHAELQTIAGRPVQTGDFVIIDYSGSVEGRPLSGATAKNVTVELGGGRFLPEIEAGIVGMQQGEERAIPVHFSPNHRDTTLAGKVAYFHVTLLEIKEKILPALDDELARTYENLDSLAALRERAREDVDKAVRQQADVILQREILERLIAAHPIEVPELLVHEQIHRAYLQQRRQETGNELTEADYHIDPATLPEAVQEQARNVVRGQVILRRIAAESQIQVTPAEVDEEMALLAARTAQNPDALKKTLERNGTLNAIEAGLLERKIFAAILASMQITDTIVDHVDDAPQPPQGASS